MAMAAIPRAMQVEILGSMQPAEMVDLLTELPVKVAPTP